jgi:riboflavin biosynthesis pyrimidine reductase
MGKLVEATHVTLGGEVGTNDWALPYLDDQHSQYAMELLTRADALLLGPLDAALMEHGLIDEFHLFLTPVAIGKGKHLFESIDTAPHLRLVDVRRFDSGVVILIYAPK